MIVTGQDALERILRNELVAEARESETVVRACRLSRLSVRYLDRYFRTGSPVSRQRFTLFMGERDGLVSRMSPWEQQAFMDLRLGKGIN
jgi:hypothetical protein